MHQTSGPASQAGARELPRDLLAVAISHHQAGRLVEAERLYRRILSADPGHADALHLLGLVAHQAGQTEAALGLIRRAISRNPAAAYHANLAMILEADGRFEDAAQSARAALALAPEHAGARLSLANALRALDRPEEAVTAYEAAAAVAPADPALWSNLGTTLDTLGRHEEAVDAFRRALALAPGQAGLHSNLGSALNKAARVDEAVDAHRDSIRVDPTFVAGYTNLATVLLEAGRAGEAAKVLETALSLAPGDRKALALSAIAAGALGEMQARDALLDFEGLMADRLWPAPAGFESLEGFHRALVEQVLAHPSLAWEPASKSTRQGSQTRELRASDGALASLEGMIREAFTTYLERVPSDSAHPFHAAAPKDWDLTIWATVLEPGGHQAPHIHPTGWLSGVYYADVPEAAADSPEHAGWIEFGRPPASMEGLGGFPVRLFEPQAGRMLLFPSYFYHRTLPFAGTGRRISIAFDLMPRRASGGEPVLRGRLTPEEAASELSRAEQLLRDGGLEEADAILSRLPDDLPPAGRVAHLRGLVAHRRGRLDEAVEHIRAAVEAGPEIATFRRDLGSLLHREGRLDAAAEQLEHAATLEPQRVALLLQLANIYSDAGDRAAAIRSYERALLLEPGNGTAHYGLALLKRFTTDDAQLDTLRGALADRPAPDDEALLNFALARALEHTGDTDGAFAAYERGNRLKRAQVEFDIAAERSNTARIIKSFPAELFRARQGVGLSSDLPVFVVGMPRSGTTLVEQILDSHPEVHGAGELNDLWRTVNGIAEWLPPGQALPEAVGRVPDAAWKTLGERLVTRLREYAPGARRIVDKLPFNYTLLGIIRLMLPDAAIVHCVRDPRDTCLSCYTTAFGGDRGFTSDLTELGETYRLYAELMAHWRSVLPGPFHEVRYEALVEDLEGEAKRLVAFLGLEWSEDCLDFHRNRRPVQTASMVQVRQPVYTSSVGRWQRYEKHLGPLLDALGTPPSRPET